MDSVDFLVLSLLMGNPSCFALLSFRDVTSQGFLKCISWPVGTQAAGIVAAAQMG